MTFPEDDMSDLVQRLFTFGAGGFDIATAAAQAIERMRVEKRRDLAIKDASISGLQSEVIRLQALLAERSAEAERWAKECNERDDRIDEVERLQAEVQAIKADALRYRTVCLRARQRVGYEYGDGALWQIGIHSKSRNESFNAAIDAAMADPLAAKETR